MIIKGYLLTFLYFAIVSGISLSFRRVFKVRNIITRKSTHILASLVWFIMYIYFGTSIHMIIPPLLFVIMSFISYKYKLFELFLTDGEFLGIIYYFLSILILASISFIHNEFIYAYGIAILCMGLADGFAPLVAGFLKSKDIVKNKTITGTLTVLVVSILVVYLFNYYFAMDYNIFKIIIIGIASALLELIGRQGLDNLYLPLGVAAVTYFLGVL